jgi:hypothetical protein
VTEEFRATPLLKKREEEDNGIFRGMTLALRLRLGQAMGLVLDLGIGLEMGHGNGGGAGDFFCLRHD